MIAVHLAGVFLVTWALGFITLEALCAPVLKERKALQYCLPISILFAAGVTLLYV